MVRTKQRYRWSCLLRSNQVCSWDLPDSPALLINCGVAKCLTHIGTAGIQIDPGKRGAVERVSTAWAIFFQNAEAVFCQTSHTSAMRPHRQDHQTPNACCWSHFSRAPGRAFGSTSCPVPAGSPVLDKPQSATVPSSLERGRVGAFSSLPPCHALLFCWDDRARRCAISEETPPSLHKQRESDVMSQL